MTTPLRRLRPAWGVAKPPLVRCAGTVVDVQTRTCWRCQAAVPRSALFCPCTSPPTLQPVDHSSTFFELLGVSPGVRLEPATLDKSFKALQRRLHPDLYAQRPSVEQELSAANSARVNQAYQTLKSPLERVKYLLELHGIGVLSEEGAAASVPTNPALLMEVMEIREAVDECTSRPELAGIAAANAGRIDACLAELEQLYARGEVDGLADPAVRLQYYSKIDGEVRSAIERCSTDTERQ